MRLLAEDEPPAVTVAGAERGGRLLLVCDHASNRLPRALGDLGLAPGLIETHIGWDIGAAAVAQALGAALDAPVVLAGYSRLVIDCNRWPDDPTAIPLRSGGHDVPGNRDLAPAALQARVEGLWRPFQDAVADTLARLGPGAAVLSIHSFTPEDLSGRLPGGRRPWDVGVLWDDDPATGDGRLARPLLAALRAAGDLTVGDNQPYSARDPVGYTVDVHAHRQGRPHAGLEIRQDLIATPAGQASWAARLGDVLPDVLAAV